MNKHTEYANGLREIADWIEAHPTIALPGTEMTVYGANERSEAAEILRELKPCKKDYLDEFFYIKRDFGPVTLSFMFYRKKVCVAKVVGKKLVEEVVKPERTITIPAETIPAHEEDIIEWDCGEPLLVAQPEAGAA